jgi:hypothetical protein
MRRHSFASGAAGEDARPFGSAQGRLPAAEDGGATKARRRNPNLALLP